MQFAPPVEDSQSGSGAVRILNHLSSSAVSEQFQSSFRAVSEQFQSSHFVQRFPIVANNSGAVSVQLQFFLSSSPSLLL